MLEAAAEGFIEVGQVFQHGKLGGEHGGIGRVAAAFGIEHFQRAGHAVAVAQINQAQAVVVGFLGLHAGIVLLLQGFARYQGVRYVLEGGLHGFFIRGHGRLLAQFGHV